MYLHDMEYEHLTLTETRGRHDRGKGRGKPGKKALLQSSRCTQKKKVRSTTTGLRRGKFTTVYVPGKEKRQVAGKRGTSGRGGKRGRTPGTAVLLAGRGKKEASRQKVRPPERVEKKVSNFCSPQGKRAVYGKNINLIRGNSDLERERTIQSRGRATRQMANQHPKINLAMLVMRELNLIKREASGHR